jgi:hypothetical protein
MKPVTNKVYSGVKKMVMTDFHDKYNYRNEVYVIIHRKIFSHLNRSIDPISAHVTNEIIKRKSISRRQRR